MVQINFLIATHSFVINKGLSGILKEFRNVSVAEIVENIDEMEVGLKFHKPDYLIISTSLISQIDAIKLNKIYQLSPTTEIIHLKTQPTELPLRFGLVLPLQAARKECTEFISRLVDKKQSDNELDNSDLSEREKDILSNVAMGKTNKEIADDLNISIHTVITHRKNITAKLGIKSISGLTVYAIFNGLISMDDVE